VVSETAAFNLLDWIPEDVVLVAPEFEGYRCFVYEHELVIVDLYTLEIVAVIPV
jgi:hypothetical protein